MPEFLVLLLMQVTIFSSITAIILIAVKQIFKCRIPPLIGAILWIILLARLVCPIFPESKISIYNVIPVGRNIMFSLTNDIGEELSAYEAQKEAENNPYIVRHEGENPEAEPSGDRNSRQAMTVGEYLADVVNETDTETETDDCAHRMNIAVLAVYLTGVAVSLNVSLFFYQRAKRTATKTSVPCEDEAILRLYRETAEKLDILPEKAPPLRCGITSMLIGCRKPQISCRDDLAKNEMRMVFAHELLHYKYLDNPILLFSTVVVCFFWYNPLIWIVRNLLREDLEVLCDARTLTYCRIPRTDYALMLCRSCAYAELAGGAGCHMSASGRRLKNRLRTISSEKNKRFLSKVASAVLCAAIMMVCLTNPIVSQNSEYSDYIGHYAELTGGDERAMHLTSQETVSSYLGQLAAILRSWYGDACAQTIGSGSLERFKRICAASDDISKDAYNALLTLRTDEPLTNRSYALISDCAARLIQGDCCEESANVRLLPERLPAADMDEVLRGLTEAEAEALLKCYNRGVKGAEVSFDVFYTEAMMDLISDRLSDSWNEIKFMGFYTQYDLSEINQYNYSEDFQELLQMLHSSDSIYICDPFVTSVEKNTLEKILGAAKAGQQENVYYLKEYEDGCTFDMAERLLRRSGMTVERMINGYALIGEAPLSAENDTGAYVFTQVRSDEVQVVGTALTVVRETVQHAYTLALIDSENGMIDLTQKLSCGQGIAYAYRFAAAMMPVSFAH